MERGKAQRVVVWVLGLIVVALILSLGRPILEAIRERLFPNPSQAIVGTWVSDRDHKDPEAPDYLIEFTATNVYTERNLADPASPLSSRSYRIATIDGRRLVLLGPNTSDRGDDKELIEVPFSFESRDVLLLNGRQLHRRKP